MTGDVLDSIDDMLEDWRGSLDSALAAIIRHVDDYTNQARITCAA